MNKTNINQSDDPATIDQLDWLFTSIEKITCKLSGFKDYQFDLKEKKDFIKYLKQSERENLDAFLSEDYNPLLKQSLTIELIESGVEFVEASQHYKKQREELKRKEFLEECQANNIPLDLVKNLPDVALIPSDCQSLHDWPDKRLPANGVSGRLENAGQFIQRLMNENIYDKSVYGELFMSDLRHINSSLYYALAKWQSRTKTHLLRTKREEIDDLLKAPEERTLTVQQASQLRNARWRRQALTASP
uniref:Uncharacterized protein n=1 Tax=uncultured Thiotrichaceae bacterium TaxID=298394 RepID=A0A6S6UC57_9GAMM|nr:MAG: Unknown protein [uncultured Thiotrichaceae bacterium]